ncbi:hypothetical protein OHA18_41395 [Kribbella sp. NBC_00709]|uniref:hypothetical protein n=1 Tax=Kribbella sp. NBC_00709 TaxID=2975972 RepID=UPI002E29BAD4|nr:hypothetical protein [Kribbella sp. NBC_00709]
MSDLVRDRPRRMAGARSVGYANKPGKADDLPTAGATALIDGMKDLPSMLGLAI